MRPPFWKMAAPRKEKTDGPPETLVSGHFDYIAEIKSPDILGGRLGLPRNSGTGILIYNRRPNKIGRRLRERKSVHHLAVLSESKPEPMQCDRTMTKVERQEHRRRTDCVFYCGDSTHAISNCPKRTRRFDSSAVIGTVQSKFLLSITLMCSLSSYSVMAFVDSGAALNLMDLDYAKRCGFFLELLRCPIPLRGIDATPLAKNKPQYWAQLTMCNGSCTSGSYSLSGQVESSDCPGVDSVVDRLQQIWTQVDEPEGIKIIRFSSPIFYGNVESLKDDIKSVVGFDAVRVFNKRTKAQRKINKLLKKKLSVANENGIKGNSTNNDDAESDDDMDTYCDRESRELKARDLNMQVDWNTEFPDGVSIPVVTIHSIIFDFGQVCFLDVVAVDCLKVNPPYSPKIKIDDITATEQHLLFCSIDETSLMMS
ncbi:unnamed protein product [Ranitomeya imitator]|uniref:STAS domain-containing protein n=1 Tax=Ranitomeya imitator TaxID=111125 RepID=A0ABN9MLN0_9NEOB|nr:unnamed protein product [Ranitomeya imitator]